jgi:hypothetical protein
LDEHVEPAPEALADKMADLIMRGVLLGQIEAIMNVTNLGWLDKLAEFDLDRERRRAGAKSTNAKSQTAKENALGEALRIAGKNPTLSHEELALKVRESLGLATTVRTLSGWVKGWRRQGFIAPIKET